MDLMNAVAWAVVELQNQRPNVEGIRAALDQALVEAARLATSSEVQKSCLVKMAQVMGG